MKKSSSLTEEVRKIQEAIDSNNQASKESRGCHFIELARHLDAVFGLHAVEDWDVERQTHLGAAVGLKLFRQRLVGIAVREIMVIAVGIAPKET